jgi:hypothetical protein
MQDEVNYEIFSGKRVPTKTSDSLQYVHVVTVWGGRSYV